MRPINFIICQFLKIARSEDGSLEEYSFKMSRLFFPLIAVSLLAIIMYRMFLRKNVLMLITNGMKKFQRNVCREFVPTDILACSKVCLARSFFSPWLTPQQSFITLRFRWSFLL